MRHRGQLKPELRWASSSSYGTVRARVSSVGPRLRVNLSIPAREVWLNAGGVAGRKQNNTRWNDMSVRLAFAGRASGVTNKAAADDILRAWAEDLRKHFHAVNGKGSGA